MREVGMMPPPKPMPCPRAGRSILCLIILANGRQFRILNIVDDCSRECVLQIVDFSISGQRLACKLGQLARRLSNTIVFDNGLKFTCKAMFCWAKLHWREALLHLSQGQANLGTFSLKSFNRKLKSVLPRSKLVSQPVRMRVQPSTPGSSTITTLDYIVRLAKSRPQCSRVNWPDMLNLPHQTWLRFRGTVTADFLQGIQFTALLTNDAVKRQLRLSEDNSC